MELVGVIMIICAIFIMRHLNEISKHRTNRVAGGLNPPAPTTPSMRVRTGRFTEPIEP